MHCYASVFVHELERFVVAEGLLESRDGASPDVFRRACATLSASAGRD
jgi:hypothetical protein